MQLESSVVDRLGKVASVQAFCSSPAIALSRGEKAAKLTLSDRNAERHRTSFLPSTGSCAGALVSRHLGDEPETHFLTLTTVA